jgi:hypothetical protein
LEVLHLWHLDELHERKKKFFIGLFGKGLFNYIDALQKFRTRASSGNSVIYNCSDPSSLCDRIFICFRYPYPNRCCVHQCGGGAWALGVSYLPLQDDPRRTW